MELGYSQKPLSPPRQKRIDLLDCEPYDEGRLKAELRAKDPTFARLSNNKQHKRAYAYMKELYDRGQTIIKNGVAMSRSLPPTNSSLHEEADASSCNDAKRRLSKRKVDSTDAESSSRKRLIYPSAEGTDAFSATLRRTSKKHDHTSSVDKVPPEKHLWAVRQAASHTVERTVEENAFLLTPLYWLAVSKIAVIRHTSDHPLRFVGYASISNRFSSLEEICEDVRLEQRRCSSHPEPGEIIEPAALEFEYEDPSAYCRSPDPLDSGSGCIIDLAKKLYSYCPRYHRLGFPERDRCFGIVCRGLLAVSDKFKSILPVRIELDYTDRIGIAQPQFYAMLITTTDSQRLLPVRMALRGSWNEFAPTNALQSGWSVLRPRDQPSIPTLESREIQQEVIRKIFTHFQESPVLHCEDAVTLGKRQHGGWITRRFADAWRLEFDPSLDLTKRPHGYIVRLKSFPGRCEVFTQTVALVERILDTGLVVKISGSVPTHPFELLRLEALELRRPLATPDGEARAQALLDTLEDLDECETLDSLGEQPPETGEQSDEPMDMTPLVGPNVNGKPSCRMFKDCNLEREADSLYCAPHSRAMVALVRKSPIRPRYGMSVDDDFLKSFAGQDSEMLDPTRLGPRDYECLVELGRLVRDEPQRVWVVDAEYQALSFGKSPFVMEFAARNARNEKMVDFHVDYEAGDIEAVFELVLPFACVSSGRAREIREGMLSGSFIRNYGGGRTHGIRIADAREVILAAGYNRDTHVLLSWGTTLDFDCFEHLLSGEDSPVVDSVSVAHHINIMNLCKHMLPPRFPSMSLRVVDAALRQGPPVEYHHADVDVWVTCHIVREMVDTIRPHAVRREVGHLDTSSSARGKIDFNTRQ